MVSICNLAVIAKRVRTPAGERLFLYCYCYTTAQWTFNDTNTLPYNSFVGLGVRGLMHYNTLSIMNTEPLNVGYYTCYCSQKGQLKMGKKARSISEQFIRCTIAL